MHALHLHRKLARRGTQCSASTMKPQEQGSPCKKLLEGAGRTAVRYMLRSAAYLAMRLAAAAASSASSTAFTAACETKIEVGEEVWTEM